VSAAEAYKMVEMLERFWMQQDDSGIPFVAASQKMKDNVSMIRTKQLVQRNIDSFFQRIQLYTFEGVPSDFIAFLVPYV
jgi:hypothetical protein